MTKKEEIVNAIKQRKEAAAKANFKAAKQLHQILLADKPMPQGIWDKSCDNLKSTGFFGIDGEATQAPKLDKETGELIMESDGYGISKKQLEQYEKAKKDRPNKINENNEQLTKGVAAFSQTKDCEIKSLTFCAGVTGKKKAKLNVSMTATPTKATVNKLTL